MTLKKNITKVNYGILSLFIIILVFPGCGADEKMVFFSPGEVRMLLVDDTIKSWSRVSRTIDGQPAEISACELYRITTYQAQGDSLFYSVKTDPDHCENGSMEISKGVWSVLPIPTNIEVADKIQFIQEGDTIVKDVLEITSLFLTLRSFEKDQTVVEDFQASP